MKAAATMAGLAALLLAGAARGRAGEPDLRFGVMTHFAQGWPPAEIALLACGGIPAVRDELYWESIEPQRGKLVFPAAYDLYLADLRKAGIAPLIVLDFANHNYDGNATPHTADGFAGYANYAAAVVQRYPEVKAVEIWDEYNGSFCTGPAAQDRAGTYLRMLAAAYARIKAVRPDVTVVAGSTAGVPMPYWEKLLAGGALDHLDALSVHPYRYHSAPEGIEDDVASLQRLVRRYGSGRPKPVWVTEIGWATPGRAAAGELPIDEATQARFLVRACALLLSAGVERVYWYELRDDQGQDMGLVRGEDPGLPKPAFLAMANLIRQLRGAAFVRREYSRPGLYSLLFRRPDGEEVRVLWALEPAAIPAAGLTGATDLVGDPVPLRAQLRLDDSPLLVTGRLAALPPPPPATETLLTDSRRDFSSTQGGHGWFYGTLTGAGFTALPTFAITDWTEQWTGLSSYLAMAAEDQHPSVTGPTTFAAVRRWVSDHAGPVHVAGSFQCGSQGDGVGVSVVVNGRRLFRQLLGGGQSVRKTFDFVQKVEVGTAIDFVVDPGPGKNFDYDATTLAVTISALRDPDPAAGRPPPVRNGLGADVNFNP